MFDVDTQVSGESLVLYGRIESSCDDRNLSMIGISLILSIISLSEYIPAGTMMTCVFTKKKLICY